MRYLPHVRRQGPKLQREMTEAPLFHPLDSQAPEHLNSSLCGSRFVLISYFCYLSNLGTVFK